MPTKATRTALFFTVILLFVRVWRPLQLEWKPPFAVQPAWPVIREAPITSHYDSASLVTVICDRWPGCWTTLIEFSRNVPIPSSTRCRHAFPLPSQFARAQFPPLSSADIRLDPGRDGRRLLRSKSPGKSQAPG